MVKINDENDLEQWLKDKPDKWAVRLATRAVLRSVPALSFQIDPKSNTISDFSAQRTLAAFRAIHAAWFISEVGSATIPDAVDLAASECERFAKGIAEDTRRVLFCMAYAAYAASGNNPAYTAASSILDAIRSPGSAIRVTTRSLGQPQLIERVTRHTWDAFQQEINSLERGLSVDAFDGAPLWPTKQLTWVSSSWRKLKTSLFARNENWSVWTDWYESIIRGDKSNLYGTRPITIDLELLSQEQYFWERSVERINSDIKRIIARESKNWDPPEKTANRLSIANFIVAYLEERGSAAFIAEIMNAFERDNRDVLPHTLRSQLSRLTAGGRIRRVAHGAYEAANSKQETGFTDLLVEPQTPGAIQFESPPDRPIEVKHKASAGELSCDEKARKRHREVRRRVDQLLATYARDQRGGNASAAIIDEISLFSESLGESIEQLDPDLLIPRGDGLRRDLTAYSDKSDFSNLTPVADDLLLALGKLIADYNNYVSFDSELARRDEALLGPDARKKMVPPQRDKE